MGVESMPSPPDATTASRKKKKACRRCRHRKQRCDFEQPCHNCLAAGVECAPVVQEVYQNYPPGYVTALERHAAVLERTLNERVPGTALDHLESVRTQYLGSQPTNRPQLEIPRNAQSLQLDSLTGSSPEAERTWHWQPPQTPNFPVDRPDSHAAMGSRGQNHSSPPDFAALSATPMLAPNMPTQSLIVRQEPVDEIPTATAASFFRTYFQFIHPQYPFLSVKDCGDWYTEWKMAPGNNPIAGWPAFFVKMVRPTIFILSPLLILSRSLQLALLYNLNQTMHLVINIKI